MGKDSEAVHMPEGCSEIAPSMSPVGRAVDSGSDGEASSVLEPDLEEIDWVRCLPFALLHLACGAVFLVGVSPVAVAVAGLMYVFHMFAITAFYHRYFSHRAFRTSRVVQFLGTNPPPAKGERRRIETERVVRDALLGAEEYLEGFAERPTSALKLRVLFPEGRFARTARAEMTPPRSKLRTIRPRIGKDGRAALSWTIRNPDELATYRLAWNW